MSDKNFFPFCRPMFDNDEFDAVRGVLESGWITTGPKVIAFEEQFARLVGARHAISLSSATAGLHLVLSALKLPEKSEIITTSMTWGSTVNMIVLTGHNPVFADIDRNTLMVSPKSLASCFSEKTALVLPVHFAGAPLDLDPIRELAKEKGASIVEDAAHAVGTSYKGRHIGNSGTAIFSFHPIKNITTGEGGMVVTDDPELAENVRQLRFHGLGANAWARYSRGKTPPVEILQPGFKYNMMDLQAVLGLCQLKKLPGFLQKRRELAREYRKLFEDVEEISLPSDPTYSHEHSRHLFPIFLDIDRLTIDRDQFVDAVKEKGVGLGVHFKAVHMQRYYRQAGFAEKSLPETEWVSERICSPPLYPGMEIADCKHVVDIFKSVLKENRK